ncbi:hypothetical protein Poli38472_005808 [Pythium oligandrum]|uniref:Exonuclease domain-containing protein n=1 Tax=Pythium oligandrum TaxID=41045 RepID=A0A8K1FLK2_PYTOL|nr:hypothetical protein Poli38472_005808 [Pythium oligandrum]|eukprot:TMW68340.1 hypothetical protein Poli38472_005808 [Pythium oligandrum]
MGMGKQAPRKAPKGAGQANMKKRRLAEAAAEATAVSYPAQKKQRIEEVAAIAKDVMIKLLTDKLSYDVSDAEWEKLVELTRQHPKYEKNFAFPSDSEEGWVKTKSKKKDTHLKIVALDCEMCVTASLTDPNVRKSNALCRISAVNGEDMIRTIISDFIVHQPEEGFRMVDPKADIHGITAEMIDQSKITMAKVQKHLLKYISSDTIVVGHSVHGDLASLRIDHRRVIDTAMIYQRKGGSPARSTPGLKCLTKFLLDFEMPDGHDSAIDAQASMLAAKYAAKNECGAIIPSATELHGPREPARVDPESGRVLPRNILSEDLKAARSCRLRVHRIPKGVTSQDIEQYFVQHAKIVPAIVENIVWLADQNKGSANVTFSTNMHAQLAYETLEAKKTEVDSIGRAQKIVSIPSLKNKGKVFSNIKVGIS